MSSNKGIERRDFLKVLGAAGASATLAGCANEPDRLIPYLVQPEEIVPGTSTWYRTTCRECPAGCGMTIRTREGRAIKAEGNAQSPISHGKLCARGQASLHGLYDPDRIPQALVREAGDSWGRIGWDRAEQTLADAVRNARGRAVFLTRPDPGSMDRLLDEWTAALGVRRVKFDTFGHEPIRAAHRRLYGTDALPIYDFEQARTVVSFGGDFLETFLSPVDYAHGFAQGHAYGQGHRGTLIWVSPHQSLTGLNADTWLAARAGTEHLVALAMARLVADETGRSAPGGILGDADPVQLAAAAGVDLEQVRAAAHQFAEGPSLAVGPGVAATHAAATTLAVAVAVLNEVAGSYGRTVRLGPSVEDRATHAEMRALVQQIAAGEVDALLVHGPNPLYELPDREAVEAALERVQFIASFSPWLDETTAHAHLLVPDHHFLESWGDSEPRPGVRSLIQPVMTPVFQTKQTGDVLLSVARRAGAALGTGATTFYDYLREQWQGLVGAAGGAAAGFDDGWTRALRDGVVVTTEVTQATPTPGGAAGTQPGAAGGAAGALSGQAAGGLATVPAPMLGDGELNLVVYPSYRFYDGRLANRPWLQELPDPVTKHTWGSVLEMHPATAELLGVDTGHIVEVTTPNGTLELPVYEHPGIRRDTVAIQLGQGHERFGRYASDRGVNAIRLLSPEYDQESGALIWIQTTATVTPTGDWERQPFSSTQDDLSGRHLFETVPLTEAIEADMAATATVVAGAAGTDPAAEEQEAHAPVGHGAPVNPMEAEVPSLQESGGFAPAIVEAAPQDYPPPGTHYGEYTEAHPRWGMTIDMDRCIGCSACQVACQAENNIGMVGPDLVAQGRLIQWIRIERYFEEAHDDEVELADEGGAEHRPVTFLPMLCQHCGNAPCEPVCPVYAAYHTPDGLNAQVYNRCVGTRYCANNCPYKVRYFNYFSYEWPEPLNWQLNPDVTVREKGIMEKCTFCVQRIRDTQHQARLGGRTVRDGEIVPACAQTCPTEAIAFGNIDDPNSRVANIARSGRAFRVFEELNTQPGIVYLKKVADVPAAEAAAH